MSADVTRESVRAEVDAWLGENWDPELSLLEWRRRLVAARWMAPSWPVEWHGRGLPPWASDVVGDAISAAGAVGQPLGVGTSLARSEERRVGEVGGARRAPDLDEPKRGPVLSDV